MRISSGVGRASAHIGAREINAMVTVPDKVNSRMRRHIKELGEDGFQALVGNIVRNMKPLLRYRGVRPWFYGLQRRWDSLSSPPYVDATIGFDLRTAGEASKDQSRNFGGSKRVTVRSSTKKDRTMNSGSAPTLNTTR